MRDGYVHPLPYAGWRLGNQFVGHASLKSYIYRIHYSVITVPNNLWGMHIWMRSINTVRLLLRLEQLSAIKNSPFAILYGHEPRQWEHFNCFVPNLDLWLKECRWLLNF
jgi:hypothetical protein